MIQVQLYDLHRPVLLSAHLPFSDNILSSPRNFLGNFIVALLSPAVNFWFAVFLFHESPTSTKVVRYYLGKVANNLAWEASPRRCFQTTQIAILLFLIKIEYLFPRSCINILCYIFEISFSCDNQFLQIFWDWFLWVMAFMQENILVNLNFS